MDKKPFFRPTWLKGHRDSISKVILTDTNLFSSSFDGGIKVWDLKTHQEIRHIGGHSGKVVCLDYNQNFDKLLFSGSDDGTLRIWNLLSGREDLKLTLFSCVSCLDLVKGQNNNLVMGLGDGSIHTFDFQTQSEIWIWKKLAAPITNVKFDLNNSNLFAGGLKNGNIGIWDCRSQNKIMNYQGKDGIVSDLYFNQNELIVADEGSTIKIFDIRFDNDNNNINDNNISNLDNNQGRLCSTYISVDNKKILASAVNSQENYDDGVITIRENRNQTPNLALGLDWSIITSLDCKNSKIAVGFADGDALILHHSPPHQSHEKHMNIRKRGKKRFGGKSGPKKNKEAAAINEHEFVAVDLQYGERDQEHSDNEEEDDDEEGENASSSTSAAPAPAAGGGWWCSIL